MKLFDAVICYLSGGTKRPSLNVPGNWYQTEQFACFVARDLNGQQLANLYYEEEPGQRSAAKLVRKDEESARTH